MQVPGWGRLELGAVTGGGELCLLPQPEGWGLSTTSTEKRAISSLFFWTFICLTPNDTFLIMTPIGQWHYLFSAHNASQLARSIPIHSPICFYSTPRKGGSMGLATLTLHRCGN